MRTIVIGGGIAGLLVAKKLQATLISDTDHFVFLPRLPELLRKQAPTTRIPISKCYPNTIIARAKVDLEKGVVYAEDKELVYDQLVIATGAKPNAPVAGVEKYAHNFYNYRDVQEIKKKVGDKRVVIMGGGPTGVEVAMELASSNEVTLLQRPDQVLKHFSSHTRSYALRKLKEVGVRVYTSDECTKVTKKYVVSKQAKHPYDLAIWAGGVQANTPEGLPEGQPVLVDEHLNVVGHNNVWAVGDCARSGSPLTAQAAQQEAVHVAKNIKRVQQGKSRKTFHFHSKGDFLLLDGVAVMDSRFTLKGRLTHWIRNKYYDVQIARYLR